MSTEPGGYDEYDAAGGHDEHDEPRVLRLAGDIARNLPHLSDPDVAHAIASHIKAFWDPRMRDELSALVAADPAAVPASVLDAVRILGNG